MWKNKRDKADDGELRGEKTKHGTRNREERTENRELRMRASSVYSH